MEILTQSCNEDYDDFEDFEDYKVEETPIISQESDIEDATNINICIYGLCSYDKAYRKSAKNSKINTYMVNYDNLEDFVKIIKKEKEINTEDNLPYKNLLRDFDKLDGKSIMVYFECCAFLTGNEPKFSSTIMSLISYLLFEKKCFILFSDFSLKTLISSWNEETFGLNPFVRYEDLKTGEVKITFEKEKFKNSNLKQLQVISDLVSTNEEIGNISIKVLEDTISFGFKEELLNTEFYNIEILSNVLNKTDSHELKRRRIEKSSIGQAIINFKKDNENCGKILVSNGHFCELSQINYNEDSLMSSIKSNLGQDYYNDIKNCLEYSPSSYNEYLTEAISEMLTQPLSQVE
jgi:hypothetical protein